MAWRGSSRVHRAVRLDREGQLTALRDSAGRRLYDPVAVAWATGHRFCDEEARHVVVEDSGLTRITSGTPNVTVLVHPQKEAFLDWALATLRSEK